MIKHGRFYLPDDDTHFHAHIHHGGFYQEDTFDAAVQHCKSRNTFVDVGAHVGMWTAKAVDTGFQQIIAFEPVPAHVECFIENTKDLDADIELYQCILGKGGYGKMEQFIEGNSGALRSEYSDSPKPGFKAISTLDSMIAGVRDIDLIKIDVEGFEKLILEGGKEILLRTRPVLVVEQKSNKDAIEYLQKSLGATLVGNVRRDYIFSWIN